MGILVIDIDKGGIATANALQARLGLPVVSIETPRGLYLWYRGRFKGKSHLPLPAGGEGDLIGASGQVILRDEQRLFAALQRYWEEAPDQSGAVHALWAESRTKANGANGKAGFEKGNRNNALNEAVYRTALQGDSEKMISALKAAQESGLKPGEIARTAASAANAGAAKRGANANGKAEAAPSGEVEYGHGLLREALSDRWRFDRTFSRWREYRGGVWTLAQEDAEVFTDAHALLHAPKIARRVNSVRASLGAVSNVLGVDAEHWDADPVLAGYPDGAVDLQSGELLEKNSERLAQAHLIKQLGFAPAARGHPVAWLDCLNT